MTLPHGLVNFHEGRSLDDACVVDQNVRSVTELFLGAFESAMDAFSICHIAFNRERLNATRAGDLVRDTFDLCARASRNRDRSAFARARQRDGASDAAAPAGDQGKSILKSHSAEAGPMCPP